MITGQELFRSLLKEARQSVTAARLKVFEALLNEEPLSMQQLATKTSGIDRASVYRAVRLFERLGIVQRLNTGWKYKIELTDKFADHHHHFTCVACGKTVVIGEAEMEGLIDRLAAHHGFTPTAHQIEIQGYCEQCRKSGGQKSKG